MKKIIALSFFIFFTALVSLSQDVVPDTISSILPVDNTMKGVFSGFIREGFYSWTDNTDDKLQVTSAFSDFALRFETINSPVFKAFTDMRFRYGSEFREPVNKFDIREGWIMISGKKWDLTVGQKMLKWGKCDFTNPTSKLSPQNLISRSPDREDIDMGNLLSSFRFCPLEILSFEAAIIPYYRASTLIIDPVVLPENVVINKISSLLTANTMFSYGLKADLHLRGIDFGVSWFEGYDPMPGIALTTFNLDLNQPVPVPFTELTVTPYKTSVLGLSFETTAGQFGIRSETAYTVPALSYKTNENVPIPEIKWVIGADWSSGVLTFTAEYSGKHIIDFEPASVDPIIGTEPDYSKLADMLAIPGFDLNDYVRQQVGAFNRLYNYQLKRNYHSGGLRVNAELIYGKLLPSVFSMYNFTSHDMMVIPEVKFKPSDGVTLTAGAELYFGRSGSLYDLIDDFMNGFYVSMRVDF